MVYRNRFHRSKGVTLIEVCIVVALLGVAIAVANVSIKISNLLMFQQERVLVQSEAQGLLFQMSKDVRNALKMNISTTPTTCMLQIEVFDNRAGFNIAPTNISTITYLYDQNIAGIKKTLVYPAVYGQKIERTYLKGYVQPDDPNTVEKDYPFSPHPAGVVPPYDAASLTIRLGEKRIFEQSPRVYRATSQMRAKVGG